MAYLVLNYDQPLNAAADAITAAAVQNKSAEAGQCTVGFLFFSSFLFLRALLSSSDVVFFPFFLALRVIKERGV